RPNQAASRGRSHSRTTGSSRRHPVTSDRYPGAMRSPPATSSIAPWAISSLGNDPMANRRRAECHTSSPWRLTMVAPKNPVRRITARVQPRPIRPVDQTRSPSSSRGTPTKRRIRAIAMRVLPTPAKRGLSHGLRGARLGAMSARLTELPAGMAIPYGGDKVTFLTPELAADFRPGDRLIVVQDTGDLLRVPSDVWEVAAGAVTRAHEAFGQMGSITSDQLDTFYRRFAEALEDDRIFAPIAEANAADVESARRRGRSTTRLELTDRMRSDMIEALRIWE